MVVIYDKYWFERMPGTLCSLLVIVSLLTTWAWYCFRFATRQ